MQCCTTGFPLSLSLSLSLSCTRPAYPSVFDRISTEIGRQYGCTTVFLKIWTQEFSRKYRNRDVNKCKFVASMNGKLLFLEICIFQAISRPEVSSQSWLVKKVCWTNEHRLCIRTLWKVAIFLYGRFEFKAVGIRWLHETDKEEEECTKPRKQTPTKTTTIQEKMHWYQQKQHTLCIIFGESFLWSSIKNDFCRCKQTKVVWV